MAILRRLGYRSALPTVQYHVTRSANSCPVLKKPPVPDASLFIGKPDLDHTRFIAFSVSMPIATLPLTHNAKLGGAGSGPRLSGWRETID